MFCSRRLTTLLALLVGVAASAAGQTSSPVPSLPSQEPPPPTLRTSARLVVIDVVVTNKAGAAVHDLKASDFLLKEQGKLQTITRFEEHKGASVPARVPPMPRLAPGSFTNYSPAPPAGTVNLLLLDALNTPLKDQAFVREEMLKYLKTSRPGTTMATFGLNQQLHMLQGFTSDPEVLRQAVAGKRALPRSFPLLNEGASGGQSDALSDQTADILGDNPDAAQTTANLRQFEADQQSFQTMVRTQYTLDALNALGRFLSGIPGRKNLIWFSGAFPINILPNGEASDPFSSLNSLQDEYRDTVTLLSRSQVAVYPIDARGLASFPMFSAAVTGAKYARDPSTMARDTSNFSTQLANEHGTMVQMAEDTGGKAFINTNGLKEAIDQAVDIGSNYYTLSYVPTNDQAKGDFRRIQVSLGDKEYSLSYRHGYYAESAEAAERRRRLSPKGMAGAAAPVYDPMHIAMLWGGPNPTQVIFAAKVHPATGAVEDKASPGTQVGSKTSGPYERYSVFFIADPQTVSAPALPNGKHHIEFEFVTYAYNDQGVLITSTGNRLVADLAEDRYQAMRKGGVQYQQEISVPAKNDNLFLRIGIHDLASDKVGAIEVPITAVNRLPPLSQFAPAAGTPKP